MSKEFHLGDVLTITHGRLVSPRHMGGVYDILNYMTGDNLYTHQLPRVALQCKPVLLKEHPNLQERNVEDSLNELEYLLRKAIGISHREQIVRDWLNGMVKIYGEMLTVKPLDESSYVHIDPIEELESLIGEEKVVIVNKGDN